MKMLLSKMISIRTVFCDGFFFSFFFSRIVFLSRKSKSQKKKRKVWQLFSVSETSRPFYDSETTLWLWSTSHSTTLAVQVSCNEEFHCPDCKTYPILVVNNASFKQCHAWKPMVFILFWIMLGRVSGSCPLSPPLPRLQVRERLSWER